MRKVLILAAAAAVLSASHALAAEMDAPKSVDWPHGGPFGTYDRASVQRGLHTYRQVCAGCHSLRLVAFRNLTEIGLTEDEAKVIAAEYDVIDGPDDSGEMFDRPGKLSDYFPSPFPNEKAARASNNGAYPPDFSLLLKARPGHEDYIYSLLTGYSDPPADAEVPEGMNYNPYFPGRMLAMAPPLFEDAVEYADGTKASVDQMARDVVTFMAWAGDPHMEQRKNMGVKVILFLVAFAALMYAVKRKVWSDLH